MTNEPNEAEQADADVAAAQAEPEAAETAENDAPVDSDETEQPEEASSTDAEAEQSDPVPEQESGDETGETSETDDAGESDGDETAETSEAKGDAESDEADADDESGGAEGDEGPEEAQEVVEEEAAEEAPPSLDLPEFEDPEEQGETWLAGLFERMDLDVDSLVERREDHLHVDLSGGDAERLLGLGKLGPKAIEGVETLFEAVFSGEDRDDDIYVDVDGQRRARKEMLQNVAIDMADKSVDLDKVVTVSGLNSTERRIIHRRLRDRDDVRTESVGDGVFRRLRIEPLD